MGSGNPCTGEASSGRAGHCLTVANDTVPGRTKNAVCCVVSRPPPPPCVNNSKNTTRLWNRHFVGTTPLSGHNLTTLICAGMHYKRVWGVGGGGLPPLLLWCTAIRILPCLSPSPTVCCAHEGPTARDFGCTGQPDDDRKGMAQISFRHRGICTAHTQCILAGAK